MADIIRPRFPSPPLHVVEQSPSGTYDFPRERVEVTAGLAKIYAVRVDQAIWSEHDTASNAIRVASLLNDLDRLGALPKPEHPSLRAMLAACPEVGPGPEAA